MPSVWNEWAIYLFALTTLVVAFVVGWRVWRQPRGLLDAALETVVVLVLLTVLAIVLYAVVPVEPDGTSSGGVGVVESRSAGGGRAVRYPGSTETLGSSFPGSVHGGRLS